MSYSKKAKEIYEGEGLWLKSKERKRTLRGVFFFLVKEKMPGDDWFKISGKKKPKPREQNEPKEAKADLANNSPSNTLES